MGQPRRCQSEGFRKSHKLILFENWQEGLLQLAEKSKEPIVPSCSHGLGKQARDTSCEGMLGTHAGYRASALRLLCALQPRTWLDRKEPLLLVGNQLVCQEEGKYA